MSFRQFLVRSDGSIMPLMAVLVAVFCMAMVLVIDEGLWRLNDARLQQDTDMAAYAAAIAVQQGRSPADIQKLLNVQATLLPTTSGNTAFTVSDLGSGRMRVSATRSTRKYFSKLFTPGAPTLSTVAEIATGGSAPCVLAASTTASRGIQIDNNAAMTVTGCDIQSNAPGSESIYLRSGDITAMHAGGKGSICHGGGIDVPGWDTTAINGTAKTCPPAGDPLAAVLTTPTPTGATRANPASLGWWPGIKTLEPGIYPNGLQIQNGVEARMAPGTYYVTGGHFETKNGAYLHSSDNVTIIFSSSGNFSIGDGSGIQTLTAPQSGPYAGLLMWRTKQANCSNRILMNGGATFRYDGMLYFPGCEFNMSNNARLNTNSFFTYVIADRILMTGNARMNINVSAPYGLAASETGSNKVTLVH